MPLGASVSRSPSYLPLSHPPSCHPSKPAGFTMHAYRYWSQSEEVRIRVECVGVCKSSNDDPQPMLSIPLMRQRGDTQAVEAPLPALVVCNHSAGIGLPQTACAHRGSGSFNDIRSPWGRTRRAPCSSSTTPALSLCSRHYFCIITDTPIPSPELEDVVGGRPLPPPPPFPSPLA